MKIWLSIGVLVLGASADAQVADPPPLGTVAKATKEEKAKNQKAKGTGQETKKYTNEDLGGRRPRTSDPSYPARTRVASTGTSPTPGAGDRGGDEGYWRSRAARIRERLQDATDRLNMLKARLESMKGDGLDVSLANGRSSPLANERQRLKVQVMDQEAQVRRYEEGMKALEEEGRRAGALPGWFR